MLFINKELTFLCLLGARFPCYFTQSLQLPCDNSISPPSFLCQHSQGAEKSGNLSAVPCLTRGSAQVQTEARVLAPHTMPLLSVTQCPLKLHSVVINLNWHPGDWIHSFRVTRDKGNYVWAISSANKILFCLVERYVKCLNMIYWLELGSVSRQRWAVVFIIAALLGQGLWTTICLGVWACFLVPQPPISFSVSQPSVWVD
jgi:hypothetical protein